MNWFKNLFHIHHWGIWEFKGYFLDDMGHKTGLVQQKTCETCGLSKLKTTLAVRKW